MVNETFNPNLAPGTTTNTGNTTSNPQSIGQDSAIAGQPQSLQTANSTSSINNQSTATPIQLSPVSLQTSAVQPTRPKVNHYKVSTTGAVMVGILVVVAVAVFVYTYLTNKKPRYDV